MKLPSGFKVTILTGLLAMSTSAVLAKDNGVPCEDSSECASGYCSNRLKSGKVFDTYLCMSPTANCPIPGGPGVMYEGEYNYGGGHWYCRRGVGIQGDGPAEGKTEFYYGGNCSGFWEKIDCRGKWFPLVQRGITAYCATAGRSEPYSTAFCKAAEFTAAQYNRQTR